MKTQLARLLMPILGLASCWLLQSAVPTYFTTTAAESVPPVANPIAAKQYLNDIAITSLGFSNALAAVAYDAKGNLYYANGTQVWRLNADGTDTLIAGIPVPTQSSGDGGPATLASLPLIFALSFDAAENLYIAHEDPTHYAAVVRKVTQDRNITTVARAPSYYLGDGMAVDAAGNVYLTQTDLINESPTFSLAVYATDGTSTNLILNLDGAGQVAVGGSYLYFVDNAGLHQWNLQTASGQVLVSVASNGADNSGLAAAPDGTAYFVGPNGVETVSPTGASVTPVAGSATSGYSGDGGPATAAQVTPAVLAVNPLTADLALGGDYVVRVVNKSTGIIQTVAGAPHSAGDNGPAVLAQFSAVSSGGAGGLASDSAGNLYILDQAGSQIRKISPKGIITTVAGSGIVGNSGDGGKATQAAINAITYGGVTSDAQGNLFFLNDGVQNPATGIQPFTVRKVDRDGNISTVAGGGTAAVSNGVPALSVALADTVHAITGTTDYVGHIGPSYLAADPAGNFYICYNDQILKVDSSQNLTVLAGVAGKHGYTGRTKGRDFADLGVRVNRGRYSRQHLLPRRLPASQGQHPRSAGHGRGRSDHSYFRQYSHRGRPSDERHDWDA